MPKYTLPFGPTIEYTRINATNKFYIGGQSRDVEAGSFRMDAAIGRRSEASFTVRTAAPTYFPEDTQIAIRDTSHTLIFTGYLTAPEYGKPGFALVLYHSLTACDQHRLADKRIIAGNFSGLTAAYIVNWIIDNILAEEGIKKGSIYAGATFSEDVYFSEDFIVGEAVGLIESIAFDYIKCSEALDQVVKRVSASGVPYYWQIKADGKLDFLPYTAVENSTVLDGTQIDETVNPPKIKRANPSYRNVQYVRGYVETVTQNETAKGDGEKQAWPMKFAISRTPTVSVNSTAKTVGIRGVSTGKDFYWSKGEREISQDSAGTKLLATDTLAVSYVGRYRSVVIVSNSAQIELSASISGDSGKVEEVEDSSLTTLDSELSLANALLTLYAVHSPPAIEFSTRQTGFSPGQIVEVDLPDWGITSTPMLIESMAIDDGDGHNIYYRIRAISGPSNQTWVEFFGSLFRSPQSSEDQAETTIVTAVQAYTATIGVTATYTATLHACPLFSESTFFDTITIVC